MELPSPAIPTNSPVIGLNLSDVLTMGVGAIVQYTMAAPPLPSDAPATLTDTSDGGGSGGVIDPVPANNSSSVSAAVSGANGEASVIDRTVFYLDSKFDSSNTGAPTTADFNAIAPDKVPLMPGQTAIFDNYTSSRQRDQWEFFIDMLGEPSPANITAADFEFTTGNTSTPGTGSSPGNGWSTMATAPHCDGLCRRRHRWIRPHRAFVAERDNRRQMAAGNSSGLMPIYRPGRSRIVFYFDNALIEDSGNK